MAIYLDNAATSFPKPEPVYRAVDVALRTSGGNPGRGGHQLALAAGRLLFDARETVAEFFGITDSSRIAFTSGATEALNLALFGLLRPGDRVVTTSMEHNAVTRPLRALQERGVEVVKVPADPDGFVPPERLRTACRQPTALLVVGHASNVTGTVQAIAEIGPWCRRHGIPLLVDAAQSAGVLPIDVEQDAIDLLAAPGHKGLLGPAGTGFLYVREGLTLTPLLLGGTGGNSESELAPEQMPERLESGTPNLPGLAGLTAGIDYLQSLAPQALLHHEQGLLAHLRDGLAGIPGLQLYGPATAKRSSGVLSFTIAGCDPSLIGFRLDQEHDICVRVGLHCAPDAHRTIGTYPHGTVRVSPGPFTTSAEIDALLTAIQTLAAAPAVATR